MGGTTPKFDCELAGNGVIRVKYGRGNPELHAEIAATRLLSALGFGADQMYVVERALRRLSGVPIPGPQMLRRDRSRRYPASPPASTIPRPPSSTSSRSNVVWKDAVSSPRPIRAGHSTRSTSWTSRRRLAARARRRAETAGGRHRALGQQGREPAAALPAWRRPAGRRLCQAVGDPAGPRRVVRTDQARSAQLADAGVGRRQGCRVSMKHMPWNSTTFQISTFRKRDGYSSCRCWGSSRPRSWWICSTGRASRLSEEDPRDSKAGVGGRVPDKIRQIKEAGPCSGTQSNPKPQAPNPNAFPTPKPPRRPPPPDYFGDLG